MCDLNACKLCTGCAHNRHEQCRQTVRCPDDTVTRPCSCCGGPRG